MFINNGLADVLEGGSKAIKKDELYMETASFKEFRYTIISGPQHGALHLIDPTSGQREEVRISPERPCICTQLVHKLSSANH